MPAVPDCDADPQMPAPSEPRSGSGNDVDKNVKRGGLFPDLYPLAMTPPNPESEQYKSAAAIAKFIKASSPPRSISPMLTSAGALLDILNSLLFGRGPMKDKLAKSQLIFDPNDPMRKFYWLICDIHDQLLPLTIERTWAKMAKVDWARLAEVRCKLSDLSASLEPNDIRLGPVHHIERLLAAVIQNKNYVIAAR